MLLGTSCHIWEKTGLIMGLLSSSTKSTCRYWRPRESGKVVEKRLSGSQSQGSSLVLPKIAEFSAISDGWCCCALWVMLGMKVGASPGCWEQMLVLPSLGGVCVGGGC